MMMNKSFSTVSGRGMTKGRAVFNPVQAGFTADKRGGAPVQLPANLRKTAWSNGRQCIRFKETTIEKAGDWLDATITVFSAAENGKITGKKGAPNIWEYMGEEIVCTDYMIDGDGITFWGADSAWAGLLSGTWTKLTG
jgi:hypothetical protein